MRPPHTFLTRPLVWWRPELRFHLRGRTTMPSLRTAGLAGLLVAAALVGGTIIGSVAAATAPPVSHALPAAAAAASAAPDRTAKVAEYCAAFRQAFAADLGVDEIGARPGRQEGRSRDYRRRRRRRATCHRPRGDRLKATDRGRRRGWLCRCSPVGSAGSRPPPVRQVPAERVKAALGVVKDGLDRRREGARHHPGRARLDAAERSDAQGRRRRPRTCRTSRCRRP